MTGFALGRGLTLPLDALTTTFADLGIRGSGKTYTAKRLAEQMIKAGHQVVSVDPLDVWWGLRSSADGSGDGLPVYVFGGTHADVALEEGSGVMLADLVVDTGISCVLSLRHLSKAASRRFMLAFCTRLYDRKYEPKHRTPLHLVIDEADLFVPQGAKGDVASVYGAVDDIVRRGRNVGLGVTLITQRSAVISKDVLTQCEVLLAHRTVGKQDRDALERWVEAHDAGDDSPEFMRTLSTLAVGECWVWSPGFLDVFKRVSILKAETFDSSATPKVGKARPEPKKRLVLDLDQVKRQMSEVVERAEARDPKKLGAEILRLVTDKAHLEAKVAAAKSLIEQLSGELESADRQGSALNDEQIAALASFRADADDLFEMVKKRAHVWLGRFEQDVAGLTEILRVREEPRDRAHTSTTTAQRPTTTARPAPVNPDPERWSAVGYSGQPFLFGGKLALAEAERRTLLALCQFPGGLSKAKAALLTGYSGNASTIPNAITALRKYGFVEQGLPWRPTPEGIAAMPDVDAPPRGFDLVRWWLDRLGLAERSVAMVLIDDYPKGVTRERAAEVTGYTATASTIPNAITELRKAGMVTKKGTPWTVDPEFAEAAEL